MASVMLSKATKSDQLLIKPHYKKPYTVEGKCNMQRIPGP